MIDTIALAGAAGVGFAIGLASGWALVWCAVDREHEKALADIRADKEGDDAEV